VHAESAGTTDSSELKIKVTSCGISERRRADEHTRKSLLRCTALLAAAFFFLYSVYSSLRVLSRELGCVLVVLRLVLFEHLRDLSPQRIVRVRKLEQLHDLREHRAGRQGRGPGPRKDAPVTGGDNR